MDEDEYIKLLDRARDFIPEDAFNKERFEIPQLSILIEGKTTIIQNFPKIVDLVHRSFRHILRFILQEIGTAGDIQGNRVILKGLFKVDTLNDHLKHYIETYVLCPVCNKPETELKKRGRQEIKVCHACGAETIPKL